MEIDVAAAALPYVSAAAGAYGSAVWQRVQEHAIEKASDSTVSTGRKILNTILRRQSEPTEEVRAAVQDLAEFHDDPDGEAALRFRLRKLFSDDPELAQEIAKIIASQQGSGITASGDRAVASHTISGIVITGDHGEVQR